ncbi:hypothetical protein V9T40_008893 [Parthenolecanium corni]|uniref:Uncharacterized protein n=1 Tax=Parthenolecanium corni TaxID=536013 RepID=A0AAN9TPF8_9HEMI
MVGARCVERKATWRRCHQDFLVQQDETRSDPEHTYPSRTVGADRCACAAAAAVGEAARKSAQKVFTRYDDSPVYS